MKFNIDTLSEFRTESFSKIPTENIHILYIDDMWDGPLSGQCLWKDSKYYFTTLNRIENAENAVPRLYLMFKLTHSQEAELEEIKKRFEDYLNGNCSVDEYNEFYQKQKTHEIKPEQVVGWFDQWGLNANIK